VEQGTLYYERFVQHYPSVKELAAAPEKKVIKLWEGLGYYARCKNLHTTAKLIATEKKGIFPNTYEELLNLKGIGPYTAAAIASFAYNIPKAVIDGNVIRVLSRFFGITEPVDKTNTKKEMAILAQNCLDVKDPASYNQAIMDFGATICKPVNPLCTVCDFQKFCYASDQGVVNHLPYFEKKLKKKSRWIAFFIITHKNKIAVHKRSTGDIWAGLYDFPSVSFTSKSGLDNFLTKLSPDNITGVFNIKTKNIRNITISELNYMQQLTHQKISAATISINIDAPETISPNTKWISINKIETYPFPRIIRDIIERELKSF
ncbi:MAG: A/G-specific adenine glycosylase, partial [Bacteroidota bacterium]